MTAWAPDILGAPFEQLTLDLGVDGDHGPLVATLVRRLPPRWRALTGELRDVDVLYVHGWSDYFFQTELADFFADRGARFFALDLRRYGRSLRPGQEPGYVESLDDYDVEIGMALTEMGHGERAQGAAGRAPKRRLMLLGHSTGGLTLTLWAARHPGRASSVVLNSPWLELQIGAVGRRALAPLVSAHARVDPRGTQPSVDLGFYTRAQTELHSLPVSGYQEQWRPPRGFPTHPGWLLAILQGHRRIAAGVDVGCPVLVLLSAASSPAFSWVDEMTRSDSVLVVDEIARKATRIGKLVTLARIDGAIHDVFLSAPPARAAAYATLDDWLT